MEFIFYLYLYTHTSTLKNIILKNIIIRVLTGAIFAIVLISSICLHSLSFLALFGVITALTIWEFCGLIKQYENTRIQRILNMIGGVYLFVATYAYANEFTDGKIFLPYLLFLILTIIAELYYKAPNPINNWAYTFFAQLYIAGCFSMLNFIGIESNSLGTISYSPLMIMAIFIFVWLSDTGAYFVGSMIGKRRLFERISPKKSWEGFFGGLIFALASSQALAWYAPEIGKLTWLGLALTVVLFGTWGDLIESLLKRTIGVKDSGNILPGHGGMLDRFDSVMLAAPASYIYIELFIRN